MVYVSELFYKNSSSLSHLECQVAMVAKFGVVTPDVCCSLVRNILHCHSSGILILWKICAPLDIITPMIYYYCMFIAILEENFVNNANVSPRSQTPL
jgi:hypothetical protein